MTMAWGVYHFAGKGAARPLFNQRVSDSLSASSLKVELPSPKIASDDVLTRR